jgi:predicted deacylase
MVQVYISGALHGNERLGPHASFYLIELLASNYYARTDYIVNLLKQREIVITPMTNAPGFRFDEREERMAGEGLLTRSSVDINRDFPYN